MDDEALVSLVRDLYGILLEEIPKLVAVLLRKHKASCWSNCIAIPSLRWGCLPISNTSIVASRVLRQHPEHEASVIDDSVDRINRATSRVSQRVDVLHDRALTETHRDTKIIGSRIQATHDGIGKLYTGMGCIQATQLKIEQRTQSRHEEEISSHEALAQRMTNKIEESSQKIRDDLRSEMQAMGRAILGSAASEVMMNPVRGATTAWRPFQLHATYEPPADVVMSYSDIISAMALPESDCLSRDLDEVIRRKTSFRMQDQWRGNWLLVTDRFRRWAQLSNRTSDLILVDGHLGDRTISKISPLSVLAASLACINVGDPIVVLYHFCSLHSHPSDALSGPIGMLRMLITQLALAQILRGKTHAFFHGLSDVFLQHIHRHSLGGLSVLFQELVGQMDPELTIYCVLDNITDFETDLHGWNAELSEFVGLLQTIVADRASGHQASVLKVLFTAAARSILLVRQIERRDCISLSAGNLLSRPTHDLSMQDDILQAMSSDT
jgi:hypothetical protein